MSGIYIHIPFCRRICHYCDFHHSASLALKGQMLSAIADELRRRSAGIAAGSVRTLYFGGGTPSVCTPSEIGALVDLVRELWQVERFEEVTLEANPDDLNPEYLDALREAGVGRLSIGIQSFDDEHLRLMNRRHTAAQAACAVEYAQRAGFDNISIDLIYGLPWMSPEQWAANLAQALGLGVQHLSAYHLTIEERTRFGKQKLQPVDESTTELHFEMLRRAMLDGGFEHYEVSNFALPGRRARHNALYWDGVPYLGVGPSAHSYDGEAQRSWNVSSNRLYLDGEPAVVENLAPIDLLNEYIMTRLRTDRGISPHEVGSMFGPAEQHRLESQCAPLLTSGHLEPFGERLRIPPGRFLTSDYTIGQLFRVE